MPEMVVRLTLARRANSARLVGPRSNKACMTSPRFAVPTADDDSRGRAALSDAPSAVELGSLDRGRRGTRLAIRLSMDTKPNQPVNARNLLAVRTPLEAR